MRMEAWWNGPRERGDRHGDEEQKQHDLTRLAFSWKPLQLTPHRSFQLIVLAFWHQSWSISPLHQRRRGAAERPAR